MSFTGHQNQVIPASAVSDIPSSLLSKRQMKAMASRNQIVEVQASNGSSQQASGTISFNLSTGSGNGYMRGGSAYLRFDLQVLSGADTNVRFNGTSASESGSCASLFRTLNINVGGLVLEQINDYDKYYRIIQAHSTNATYVQHDANITEMTTPAFQLSSSTNAAPASDPKTFCVPILSGLLNQEQHLPMWLMNSQVQIQLNLNSAPEAFASTSGATNFTITNPVLVYEKIHVDNQFEQAVRAKLASGALYELPFYTALSYRSSIADAGDYNQNIGVNLSSVCSVLHAHIASPSSGTSEKPFIANNTNLKGAGSNRIVRVDGEQVVQSQITSSAQVFNELQRSLGSLYDTNQTSVATRATYDTDYFVNGQACQRFSDADLCMKGRPANNLVIEEKACAGASTIYAYVIYEGVLMVDANGGCVVSK